jgi:hypothetical protein
MSSYVHRVFACREISFWLMVFLLRHVKVEFRASVSLYRDGYGWVCGSVTEGEFLFACFVLCTNWYIFASLILGSVCRDRAFFLLRYCKGNYMYIFASTNMN